VTRGPLSVEGSLKSEEGGMQDATVKASTSFRTKKRGKVPPRFETLGLLVRKSFGGGRTYVASKVM